MNTTAIRYNGMTEAEALATISQLTARIAENEAVYGSGCRPELRARLAAAKEIASDFRYRRALGHGSVRVRNS